MTIWSPELPPSDEPAWLRLVHALERDVHSGRISPGDRLPTHRKLAETLELSVGTVSRAYGEAEARGLVHGVVGRGTFAGRRGGEERFTASGRSGVEFDLGVTWPLHALDPDLGAALRTVASQHDVRALLRYPPHAGFPRHREAGARWARVNGISVPAEQVLVCCGVQHALHVALSTLTRPGDVVAAEAFTYPGLEAAARALHLRLAPLQMDDEGILPEAFEAVCCQRRPKALYTIPTIQNPTAGVLGEARRREIAEIARRHRVAIIEDDVHRLLHPDPPPGFFTLAPELTYSAVSLSKVVAGGLRVAYLVAPASETAALEQAIWASTWMAAPLTAEVAAVWMEDGTAEATVRAKREEAGRRQAVAREVLEGWCYRTAPNAYHLWMEVPRPWSSTAFALAARREGVAVTPAGEFAVGEGVTGGARKSGSQKGGAGEGAVRMALSAAESREELREGLERVAGVLGEGRRENARL